MPVIVFPVCHVTELSLLRVPRCVVAPMAPTNGALCHTWPPKRQTVIGTNSQCLGRDLPSLATIEILPDTCSMRLSSPFLVCLSDLLRALLPLLDLVTRHISVNAGLCLSTPDRFPSSGCALNGVVFCGLHWFRPAFRPTMQYVLPTAVNGLVDIRLIWLDEM